MKSTTTSTLLAICCIVLFVMVGFHPAAGPTPLHHTNTASGPGTGPSIDPSHRAAFAQQVYQEITKTGTTLSETLFSLACMGFDKLNAQGKLSQDSILTIIDFSKSSKEKRMFVVDLKTPALLYETVVAHGKNSGEEYAKAFSNTVNSHQSSLGFYITRDPYNGSNGYSLALEGVEKGFNDKARERAIVVHGAAYATEAMMGKKGYLGRSYGCPSLPPAINKHVINRIKQGNCLFIYYPDTTYLQQSDLLKG